MRADRTVPIGLALLLAALVAAPVVVKQMTTRQAAAATVDAKEDALRRHGFYLEEVAHAAGVDFVHRGAKLDPVLDPVMPEMASLGAAVSIVDYDHDGFADIYVVNSCEGCKNALYRNGRDGTFKDVAADLGIADVNRMGTGVSTAAVRSGAKLDPVLDPVMPEMASLGAAVSIVDYDHDGFADIYVVNSCEGCKNALYRNGRDGTFKDVAADLGIADVNRMGTGVSTAAV